MSISVRLFCFSPSEELMSVPLKLAMQLHDPLNKPCIPELANTSTRFAEVAVELRNRKPVRVTRKGYYLLRFDAAGFPDSERLGRQMIAAIDWSWMMQSSKEKVEGSVTHAESAFKHRGARWTPAFTEERAIEAAALGNMKTKRIAAQPTVHGLLPQARR
ncbi:hypothetical protein [Solimonas flava]|uniref:hypothetical protein n=1 Tax=Solimonas flava TaxID=415849 RepID=UPI0012B674C1|nr:hypothetical protein [Solimonas flava]